MRRRFVLSAVVIAYLVALLLPAAVLDGNDDPIVVYGYQALREGWNWPGTIPEFSNIGLLLAWNAYLWRSWRLATLSALVAFALSLTAPSIYGVSIAELWYGYLLWMLCSLGLFVAAAFEVLRTTGKSRAEAAPG